MANTTAIPVKLGFIIGGTIIVEFKNNELLVTYKQVNPSASYTATANVDIEKVKDILYFNNYKTFNIKFDKSDRISGEFSNKKGLGPNLKLKFEMCFGSYNSSTGENGIMISARDLVINIGEDKLKAIFGQVENL